MLVHTGIILSAMTHWEYDKAFPDLHAANESLREWVQFFRLLAAYNSNVLVLS